MRSYLSLLLVLLLGLTACHHDKTPAPKQYSTWIVNNHDTFRTNNVDSSVDCNPDHSYCNAGIMSKNSSSNWFTMGFCLSYLPSNGNWPLGTPDEEQYQDPHYAYIGFYYKSIFYLAASPHSDTLYANMHNNKLAYILPPTWFVAYNNIQDSILLQATFSVP